MGTDVLLIRILSPSSGRKVPLTFQTPTHLTNRYMYLEPEKMLA